MTKLKLKSGMKLGSIAVLAVGALTISACSTTSGANNYAAQGAPITYKAEQGQFQTASLTQPYNSVLPRISNSVPQAPRTAPVIPRPQPKATPPVANVVPKHTPKLGAPQIGLPNVDKQLHKHQRIGKPYIIMGKRYVPKHQPDYDKVGTASWYGPKFHGKLTANGEKYDMNGITAAHKTLPLNSMVKVTNVQTGKSMDVRINDRGPFIGDRIIDLSRTVADKLGMFESGLGKVRVQYTGPADPKASRSSVHNQAAVLPQFPKLPQGFPKALPKMQIGKQVPDAIAALPKYEPLRDLGNRLTQQAPAAPVAQPRFPFEPKAQMPSPQSQRPHAVIPQPDSAQVPSQNAPQQNKPSGNIEDGPITLTIKGPIHMASDKSDGKTSKPRFIPAVNYKKIEGGQ